MNKTQREKRKEMASSMMKKQGYSKNKAYAIATANVMERVHKALLNADIISEEIVNPDNKGTMTKAEIIKRDRIARSPDVRAKVRAQKGNDTDLNAYHRYATSIIMKMRGGKKGAVQPDEKRRTKKRKATSKVRTAKVIASQLKKKKQKQNKAKRAARKVARRRGR